MCSDEIYCDKLLISKKMGQWAEKLHLALGSINENILNGNNLNEIEMVTANVRTNIILKVHQMNKISHQRSLYELGKYRVNDIECPRTLQEILLDSLEKCSVGACPWNSSRGVSRPSHLSFAKTKLFRLSCKHVIMKLRLS
jgi:hypothetical protein